MDSITYTPIGIIHSPFTGQGQAPIQSTSRLARDVEGTIEIFPEYAAGLKDVDGFSHVFIIYHFDRAKAPRLAVVPYLDTEERGIFATRAPTRPNPIGVSVVRLVSIENGSILHVTGLDVLDNTPLLDIKPWIPQFDSFTPERTGWLHERASSLDGTMDDGRFAR